MLAWFDIPAYCDRDLLELYNSAKTAPYTNADISMNFDSVNHDQSTIDIATVTGMTENFTVRLRATDTVNNVSGYEFFNVQVVICGQETMTATNLPHVVIGQSDSDYVIPNADLVPLFTSTTALCYLNQF